MFKGGDKKSVGMEEMKKDQLTVPCLFRTKNLNETNACQIKKKKK